MKMKKLLVVLAMVLSIQAFASGDDYQWKATWITKQQSQSTTNSWIAFRKVVDVAQVPKVLEARIAVDTKYWLWINGEMIVYEGGLKRGPAPGDGYFDKLDIAPYLHEGKNYISILVWYFGKAGFSHQSSGICALLFDAQSPELNIVTDASWEASELWSIRTAGGSVPNHRLSESNILVDGRTYPAGWEKSTAPKVLGSCMVTGIAAGDPPFGKLVERPIPLWKDYGLKEYVSVRQSSDTLYCRLPYNCHFSPYIKLEAKAGELVRMHTDHDVVTGEPCVHAEYITKDGVQEYENLGWMNGDWMYYIIPDGLKVLDVKFRETGYNTEFTKSFVCDDEFLNEYWKKSQRTLYVCMRDTYYDCPDRERAQWWGDEVNELTEAFYLLDRNADKLARKGILELAAWQKSNGQLYAPIPTSNYFTELPFQILYSIGTGFYNYYWYSGDSTFVPEVYDRVHRYIHDVWTLDSDGIPIYRNGDWNWPDAGSHQDQMGQLPLWYIIALKTELHFANMLGKTADAAKDKALIENITAKYNEKFWDGTGYRTPGHNDVYDDRVQALAVVTGVAAEDKYPAILDILAEQYNATVFMFPTVLESLYIMGKPDLAVQRMKKMYPTVMKDDVSTLYEHWNYEGTSNHAWTGGGVISMGNRLAGIRPLSPGFKTFTVEPQMGPLKHIETTVDTNYGPIVVRLDRKGRKINAVISVPEGATCLLPTAKGKVKSIASGTTATVTL